MAIALDDVNQLLAPDRPAGPPRDRWGRYLIPDPETGKQRSWVRATTIAKTLDDPYNLTKWKLRQAIKGVASRPSIAAGVNAAQDDKHELDRLAEQALEAAGSNEARELGTNLHRILELVNRGKLDPRDVHSPWDADVSAYLDALRANSLTVDRRYVEVVLLNSTLGIAGTADNLLVDHENRHVVADNKTGAYVGWLSWAVQFAIYATATHIYRPGTDTLEPVPDIRQDHTLAIHCPAGAGRTVIEPLSVPVGYDALLMALEVRRTRALDKRPKIVATTWQPPILEVLPAEGQPGKAWLARKRLVERVARLKINHPDTARALAAAWPADLPTLSQSDTHTFDHLEQIRVLIDRTEADKQTPF